jgi:ABC-type methionine transport system permease subunit
VIALFNRNPTLWLQSLAAALAVAVSFGVPGLTTEQSALITAAAGALITAWNAALVRPIAPAAFTGLIGAGAALLAAYGLELSQEQVGTIQALIVTVLALQARQQVTPVADPRPAEQVVG